MNGANQYPTRAVYLGALALALGMLWAALGATSARAAEEPAYILDPTLTLNGSCKAPGFDGVPDPSCTGEPLAYPAPPDGPSAQFAYPRGIGIDPVGNEYVVSHGGGVADQAADEAARVDVFDDEGHFITEVPVPFAKAAAVDSKGNLYVYQAGRRLLRFPPDVGYDPEAGDIGYSEPPVVIANGLSDYGSVAIDSAPAHLDQVLVDGGGAVARYSSADDGNELVDSFSPAGSFLGAIAIDAGKRRIYVSSCDTTGNPYECAIRVYTADAPHLPLNTVKGGPDGSFSTYIATLSVAVDEGSHDFFAYDLGTKTVYRFDEGYNYLSKQTSSQLASSESISVQIAVSNGTRSLAAPSCGYPSPAIAKVSPGDACNRHYLFVPQFKSTGSALAYRRPSQAKPAIESVSTAGIGETEAQLRAAINPHDLQTGYRFELTTQAAFEVEGFQGAATVGEGTISADGAGSVNALASNLLPGQVYRFRVVAQNDLGPAPEEGQNEAAFATFDDAAANTGVCANGALRTGASAPLPDCRAYELVTPAETNGRPPLGKFGSVLASPDGGRLTYLIEGGSLPGTTGVGSFEGDAYLAQRGAAGWTTALSGPTGSEATVAEVRQVSEAQTFSAWMGKNEGSAVVDGVETFNLRYPDGHSELVGRGSLGVAPHAKDVAISPDGTHVIFAVGNNSDYWKAVQLEPNAPPDEIEAIYDRTIDPITGEEQTHVISLLPGDITPSKDAVAAPLGVSKDGSAVAFKIGGAFYLRKDNSVTYEIGENVTIAGVSENGERVFYLEDGDLKALDISTNEVIDFSSSGDVTPVNVAAGGTRAYFLSPSVLGGTNPEGEAAQAGGQNLYLSEEGTISFVATVTERDAEGEAGESGFGRTGLGLWIEASEQPARDPSRTNPDGSVLLFQSRAAITGFPAGEFPQVYRYDSRAGRLRCVSCPLAGAPTGQGASIQSFTSPDSEAPLHPSSFVPALTPDGRRAFFESTEALVSADTDGARDVYEWEQEGVGSCQRAEGCLFLISSGYSAKDDYLYAQSRDGDDVFVATADRLTDEDPSATFSIYDARVGGGFAATTAAGECLGEACQPAASPPQAASLASSTYRGAGNSLSQHEKPSCRKPKQRARSGGPTRCSKLKHRSRGHRKASKQGRTGR